HSSKRHIGSRPAPPPGLQEWKICHHSTSDKCTCQADRQHNQHDEGNPLARPIHMRSSRLDLRWTVSQTKIKLTFVANARPSNRWRSLWKHGETNRHKRETCCRNRALSLINYVRGVPKTKSPHSRAF